VKTPTSTLVRSFSAVAFALGIAMGVSVGCEKKESSSPEDGEKKEGNLCTEYDTCDACIAGQQTKGKSAGEAETECGAAVTGCWTTWKKPVVCHGEEQKQG
jgi:hypothetical protein